MRFSSSLTLAALLLAAPVAALAEEAAAPAVEGPAPPVEAAAAPAAPAGPTDVLVMAAGAADVTEEALSQTRAAAVSTFALDRARHERTVRPERDPALTARAAGCGDEACLAAVGRDAQAGYLVLLQVEREASAHRASVTLVDVTRGAILGSAAVDLPAEPAGFVEAMRAPLGPLVAAVPPIGPTTGLVTLHVDQDGAAVLLDGERVGTTPLPPGQLEAGEHVLRVELEGYEDAEQTITVARGGEQTVEMTLVPLPEPEPEPAPVAEAPFWHRWWFWTAIGVVVVGAGLGVGLGVGLSGVAEPEPEWGVPFPPYSAR